MKTKGILVTAATIGAAVALTFGGFALAEQAYVPPTEPAATATPTPEPTVAPEPTIEPTPIATPTPTAEPVPTAPAPVAQPAPLAPKAFEPEPPPAASSAIERHWPHFVPMDPQPPAIPGMEGYLLTADGSVWYRGCGEADTNCSWTSN